MYIIQLLLYITEIHCCIFSGQHPSIHGWLLTRQWMMFFAASLTKSKDPKMAAKVRKCNAHVVTMPWRNNSGTVDTGSMR